MIRPRVGLLAFNESFVREDVYKKRKPIFDREVHRFVSSLEKDLDIVQPRAAEIRSKRQAVAFVQELQGANVDAVILYPPIFVAPALVAHAANLIHAPMALVCNEAADSFSQLAYLAVAGALDQIGLKYVRVPGDAVLEPHRENLLHFLRAAAARQKLRGQTFGCIGGRSLGINTGTADVALWEKIFGVDIEHIDQFEIVRRAEAQKPDDVANHVKWIKEKAGLVDFNGTSFTPGHLEKQVRAYLGTKEIIRQFELDFFGIKCQPEMSNGFCLQCLNVSLSNDPYDAEGSKSPVVCSCEADSDGALTMQILKLISGGKPTNLNDIASMTGKEMTLANCGSMATYFAGVSPSPEENLAKVHLIPHSFGEAGGAATRFIVPASVRMTFARLFRRESRYALGVLTGTTAFKDGAAQNPFIRTRPLIFLDMNIDKDLFLKTFGSNHVHGVEGNLKKELESFANIQGIDFYDYDLPG